VNEEKGREDVRLSANLSNLNIAIHLRHIYLAYEPEELFWVQDPTEQKHNT
jgi:hypothetical protein